MARRKTILSDGPLDPTGDFDPDDDLNIDDGLPEHEAQAVNPEATKPKRNLASRKRGVEQEKETRNVARRSRLRDEEKPE